ncbi:MAG: hypothetical protein L0Y72_32380 [Gemmataceae bacterium]|nr:hypothetical protein [Gemmataceae bacterium]MCI0743753.1 hypothetical protein [Gemmataceae bacterium]
MYCRLFASVLAVNFLLVASISAQHSRWWDKHVEEALVLAKGNRNELEKALHAENVTDRYTRNKTTILSDEQHKKAFEAAKGFFDTGAKPDPALDELVRLNEEGVRLAAWKAYAASTLHNDMKIDFSKDVVKHETHTSPYTVKKVGKKPSAGWPLFIAMHGGGGVPKNVNDSQWAAMQKHYRDQNAVEGYLYVALRAPNDVWNGFYDDYMCPLTINLVRQFLLFGEADPNKVFLMGYSHGGYGAFFIGPKIPDRFAAIHASAAAPTDGTISAKSLRNTRFTFMIGENDRAYGRRERCEKFADEVEKLRAANPRDYPVAMEFQKGFGHGGLPDRDKIKDMYAFQRNPAPKHLTWEPTDIFIKDFFWLSIQKPRRGQSIDLRIEGNTLTIRSHQVELATVWLGRHMLDNQQPLELRLNGKTAVLKLTQSFAILCESIQRRGDLNLAASCRVDVDCAIGDQGQSRDARDE